MRARHQSTGDYQRWRDGSPPDGIGLGDSRRAPPGRAEREGRNQPAALPFTPRAPEGKEERDPAAQAAVARWWAREDPAQIAGAGRSHRRDPRQGRRRRRPGGRAPAAPAGALSMVLAFIEHAAGAPTMLSLEVLTMAGRVARASGRPLEAVTIGPKGAAAAGNLLSYGGGRVPLAQEPRFAQDAAAALGDALAHLTHQLQPQILIRTAS